MNQQNQSLRNTNLNKTQLRYMENPLRNSIRDEIIEERQPQINTNYTEVRRYTKNFYSKKKLTQKHIKCLFNEVFDKIKNDHVKKKSIRKTDKCKMSNNFEKPKYNRIPKELITTLYGQNIKNFNPYIQTLQQLELQQNISEIQKKHISDLCHIGAAKSFLKTKKYCGQGNYSRVNILIRPYMQQIMRQEVISLQQKYQNVVYIPTNELALSFSATKYPTELQDVLSQKKYKEVIEKVNKVISQQYGKYKQSNLDHSSQTLASKILVSLLAILLLIFTFAHNQYLLLGVFGLLLILTYFSIEQSREKMKILVRSKDVTVTIQQKIEIYLESQKTEQFQWRVGRDFYWLEIHFIRKKKRSFQKD